MMMSDRVEDFRGDVLVVPKRVISERWMSFDDRALFFIKTAGLVENY